MNKRQKYPRLGILNFEGDVLVAYRSVNLYVILDQWKEIVSIMLNSEFESFLEGKITIVDSHGKEWNYANEHENAKPSPEKLKEFMYIKPE